MKGGCTDRGEAHDSGEGEGRAGVGRLTAGGVRRLEPGLLIGPHHITERQQGGTEAERRPIDRRHDWLPELDEGVDKGPEEENTGERVSTTS